MHNSKIQLSVLLPTRGRREQLASSIQSLIDHADDAGAIEWLLAFDSDDQDSSAYFLEHIAPRIAESGGVYTCMEFQRMGYARLNDYLNALAPRAQANWWVFWNDDAIMETGGWDAWASQASSFA